ncbi:hypothetical protein, partial [Rahnella aceris]|uniref:hypothetical protein n=1 Tax=Rahnella sp. (strain Y9602) TaxID=2703885 RepID=UPI001C2666BE
PKSVWADAHGFDFEVNARMGGHPTPYSISRNCIATIVVLHPLFLTLIIVVNDVLRTTGTGYEPRDPPCSGV